MSGSDKSAVIVTARGCAAVVSITIVANRVARRVPL